jgi:hypothetical protein
MNSKVKNNFRATIMLYGMVNQEATTELEFVPGVNLYCMIAVRLNGQVFAIKKIERNTLPPRLFLEKTNQAMQRIQRILNNFNKHLWADGHTKETLQKAIYGRVLPIRSICTPPMSISGSKATFPYQQEFELNVASVPDFKKATGSDLPGAEGPTHLSQSLLRSPANGDTTGGTGARKDPSTEEPER